MERRESEGSQVPLTVLLGNLSGALSRSPAPRVASFPFPHCPVEETRPTFAALPLTSKLGLRHAWNGIGACSIESTKDSQQTSAPEKENVHAHGRTQDGSPQGQRCVGRSAEGAHGCALWASLGDGARRTEKYGHGQRFHSTQACTASPGSRRQPLLATGRGLHRDMARPAHLQPQPSEMMPQMRQN